VDGEGEKSDEFIEICGCFFFTLKCLKGEERGEECSLRNLHRGRMLKPADFSSLKLVRYFDK